MELGNTKSVHIVGGQESAEHDNVDGSRELVVRWVV